MSRMPATLVVAVALLIQATASVSSQDRPLTIVSATPEGEVGQMADANEIRIVFSEPMIALGGPVTGAPAWLAIAPAVRANYFWSGTRTLIVTPDPSTPLPYATRYTVTIDGSVRSAAGRTLGTAYRLTFTTPTPRLLGTEWYRRDSRYDRPAVIGLRFNQPMRPGDVAAHAHVRYASHQWQPPSITGANRAWLERNDPAGLARFDRKVAAVERVANSSDPVTVQPAMSWDERRFPPSPNLVVLETTSPTLPEGWLSIALDDTLPSPDGPETHSEQTTTIRLEPAFFVGNPRCSEWCDPDSFSNLELRRGVRLEEVRRALTVRDLGGGATARAVAAARPIATTGYVPPDGYRYVDLPALGFDRQPPASTWLYRVDPSLQALDGQRLDYPWVSIVENVHQRSLADWSGDVWEAAGGPRVPFFARNVVDAMVYVAPLTAGERVARVMSWGRPGTSLVPGAGGTSRAFAVAPNVIDAHGIDVSRLLGPRGTGAVWAAILPSTPLPRSPTDRNFSQPRAALLQVTNLGVTVKDSPQSTLVFVTRLDNAEPVAGASVALFDRSQREVWRGLTDSDGVAMSPALSLRDARRPWDVTYLLTAEKDGDVAWVRSDWAGDVHPARFGLPNGLTEAGDMLRGEVFTDRGVYAQGDELRIKSVVRLDSPNGMRLLPAGTAVDVEVRDSRGQQVDKRTMPLNRWSSVDWTWRVPSEASLGSYRVSLSAPSAAPGPNGPQTVGGSFLVAAFRRPDFRVDATAAIEPAVLGNPLSGTLSARYLFGAPIGAQPVRWFVRREVVHDVPKPIRERYPDQQFAFGYLPRQDSGVQRFANVTEKNDRLAVDGNLGVTVPTEPGADFAAVYRFEGDVEGVAGQHIASRAGVTIHPASFYIGVSRPPFFVDLQKPLTAAIVAANLDGAARANVPVTVSLFREQWTSERRPENPYEPTWIRKELPAGEWKVTTAVDRVSMPLVIKEGGSYILRATARDERGRPARTDVAFYALGRGRSLWRSEGNRIDLTPERRTWKPGETARILVQSPWERATALVTTEREGIRTHRRVSVRSMQDTIDVPVTDADVPNVYVSVLLVKGRTSDDPGPDESDPGRPAFRVGYTELTVDDASKRLQVTVDADRQEYRPRQDVRVTVSVADPRGGPRAGEVTLWAMDYGLLSLTDYETPDLARAIYARKQLQVLTQDNRSRLIGRRTTVLGPGPQGQGGRGGAGLLALGAPMPPPPAAMARMDVLYESVMVSAEGQVADAEIRTDFRPLVFWLGSIEAGADGRATTTVTLPDSLTTYRIMAVAGDVSSHFGAGESEIRASKPLTMLPAFPRFLSRGDRATFGAVVTNGTGAGGDATVTIRSLDAPLAFDATTTQTLRLAPGESAPVRFDAVAVAPGRARVRLTVALGSETDAFELALPVIAPARLETVAAYGDTTSSAVEKLLIPAGIVPTAGGLSVSLASTALVGLGESARYLDEYPYDCAEQRASRALALLLSADLGGAFALAGTTPGEYRAAGTAALNQLYQYQCGNGGFALWAGQCQSTSPYLTAYILNVMKVAGSLQVETNRNAIDRALSYLQNELRQPPPEIQWWPAWSASHAYAVKVLTEFGRNQTADLSRLYGAAERMPIFALSYLADALDASGDRGPRYQDVVRRLTNALRTDADRAHVEEVDDSSLRWLWNSNVRATAVVLGGLARRRDAETFAAPLVRWLLAARTNGRWGTTQENAVALEALVNYYKAFEAETPQMTATVALGGTHLGGAIFSGRTTTAAQLRVEMPDLVQQVTGAVTRDLVVSRTGTGRLYYTARLQYLPVETPPPVDRGLRVERKYQRFTPEATDNPATSFAAGDLVRVTLTVSLPHEGRFLAFTDPVPAGFEPIDGTLKTTASDLGEQATRQSSGRDWLAWWRRGGFDHVEKHDDRVVAFATRLAAGRHEFTYLVRATTAGTFNTPGTWGEAMYAPEINGRGAAAVVMVR